MDGAVIAPASAKDRLAVSVVMPCYNAEATVVRAVESIAAQSAPPLEVIAVDDGSSDATATLLTALAATPRPFALRTVMLGENRGAAEARNVGLDHVSPAAEYIAFQDADDVWLPWKLHRQIEWMEGHPACSWTAHRSRVAGVGPPQRPGRGELNATPITRRGLLLRNAVATPTVVVRRSVPTRFRPGWRHCEDLMLWLDWLDAGHEGCMLEETMLLLGRTPCSPGGSTGNLEAMHRGEEQVLRTLVSERRLDRGRERLWRGYGKIRYLLRMLRR
jgi:glycosyltransferase involved in cell wall biosynthesis